MKTKLCPGCKKVKSIRYFSQHRFRQGDGSIKFGVKARCKNCRVAETAEWRKRNGKRWVHPLTGRVQQMIAHLCHAGSSIRSEYLRGLYERQKGLCYYTGLTMTLHSKNKMDPFLMSIDRRISSMGYVRGNVVLCCMGINFLKNVSSVDTMYKALKAFHDGAKSRGKI